MFGNWETTRSMKKYFSMDPLRSEKLVPKQPYKNVFEFKMHLCLMMTISYINWYKYFTHQTRCFHVNRLQNKENVDWETNLSLEKIIPYESNIHTVLVKL